MKKRLFIHTTLIIFAGLLCLFGLSVYVTRTGNLNVAKDMVTETARSYSGLYNKNTDPASFVKTGGNLRITVISSDGAVLADSRPLDADSLKNHSDRPEILAALNGTPSAFVRRSETLGADMVYCAFKTQIDDDYVFIRAATPVAEINGYLSRTLPVLVIILLVTALLCIALERGVINRLTRPLESVGQKLRLLSAGKYAPAPPEAGGFREINEIIRETDEIAGILQKSFSALQDETKKIEYILNNMADGLFALDGDNNITLINSAALGVFSASPEITGKHLNYLIYDKTLAEAADECAATGKSALFELPVNGRTYSAAVKRLPDNVLTMVVLSDVTESRENAKRREEFFSNASHELKTPLTAIKGFCEMTSLNNKDESLNKYISGISRETDRMLSLIRDMLKLSELESAPEINASPVSLAKTTSETLEALSAAVSEKEIIFESSGDASVNADPEHLFKLMKNLVENAVRYNNRGGKVSATVRREGSNVLLIVSDDGIGISPEEQTRIFERFYRSDKSRSRQNGGTGLGLSIVKHICDLYGWKLTLKSKLGVGTEVTVQFAAGVGGSDSAR